MRSPKGKKRIRLGAAALALSVVGVLVSALPAYAATPTVTSVTPNTGPPGTPVVILGSNFQTPNATSVTFNGVAATFSITDDTHISATAPCSTTGIVHVTNGTGTDTDNRTYTYSAAAAPTVSGFNPTSGTAGTTSVVITGTNFCGASSVKFNATQATVVTINSSTQITATVPTGATSGKISVTTTAGTGVSAANFTVGPPIITSFSPTIGPEGSAVTISGSNFTGVTSVKFNGTSASFTVTTDLSIATTVPVGATSGPITVTNAVGTATGGNFTVGQPTHDRSVTFKFEQNSRVSGHVGVADNFSFCNSFVPVVIQRKSGGGWKWVDTTATGKGGDFKTYIPPGTGDYRAKVNKQVLMNGASCLGDTSPVKHHNG